MAKRNRKEKMVSEDCGSWLYSIGHSARAKIKEIEINKVRR